MYKVIYKVIYMYKTHELLIARIVEKRILSKTLKSFAVFYTLYIHITHTKCT